MIILTIILFSNVVLAQVPEDIDTTTLNKINTEHANTRKFFSQELVRQREVFFKEIEDRAIFYENEARDLKRNMFWQLGLMWAGVVLFVFSINSFLAIKMERMRTDLLARRIGEELRKGLTNPQPQPEPEVAKPQTNTPTFQIPPDYQKTQPNYRPMPKKSWAERKAEKKAEKKKQLFLKERQKMVDKVKKLDQKYGVAK